MTAYIIRRFMEALLVLIIVTFMVFSVMRLLPGDPLLLYLGSSGVDLATEEQLEELRHEYGLDRSIVVQYVTWVAGIAQGNLGKSISYNEPVGEMILRCIPKTFHLGLVAFVFYIFIGIPTGVICAIRRGKWSDNVLTVLANLGITAPAFWLGILLIYIFGLKLGWLPIQGYTSPFDDFWLSMKKSIMPVFCLSLFSIASITRQTRSSMLEVIRQDYIRTAWSKGLEERTIIKRHVLKNGLIPVITLIGMGISFTFGGSVIIETVFNIPGMGRLMVNAIFNQDYPVVQGIALIMCVIVTMSNLLVDISYGYLDPRIRYA